MSETTTRFVRRHIVTEARSLRRKDGRRDKGFLPSLRTYIKQVRQQYRDAQRAIAKVPR